MSFDDSGCQNLVARVDFFQCRRLSATFYLATHDGSVSLEHDQVPVTELN